MEKDKIVKHLNQALENQVPDVWDNIMKELHKQEDRGITVIQSKPRKSSRTLYTKFGVAAAICFITVLSLTFTPVIATIQELYDKVFNSQHIDDVGLKMALTEGIGQSINQTYYDKAHDITVQFQSIMTDDKETKLLITYQSETTNLKNYYVDNFEGHSKIFIVDGTTKKELHNVGWGSKYYDKKQNKVAKALSFDSIKPYAGQIIHLQIENLTRYDNQNNTSHKIETVWPVRFKLDETGVAEDRETLDLNNEFSFEGETYQINSVEFSEFETRVTVTGTDTGPYVDENGEQFDVMSKLENQLLNARKFDKELGYIVAEGKSGVFLKSAGEKVIPVFNKNEIPGPFGQYIMVFAPVKDRGDVVLEVGEEIKIDITK
jgi:hypothetical protein